MKSVRFLAEAEDELTGTRDRYELCRAGLGEEFVAEVEAFTSLIAERPLVFGRYRSMEVRACPLRRFPFNLLYLVDDETVWIVAIAHQRRRPGYWQKRLR